MYQSYIEMMNEGIQDAFQQRNPFEFRHVRHTRGFRADSEIGPCVVLATPSMLQTGLSRELFEAWCEDPRNGVIIADFAVQVRVSAPCMCMHVCLPQPSMDILLGVSTCDANAPCTANTAFMCMLCLVRGRPPVLRHCKHPLQNSLHILCNI